MLRVNLLPKKEREDIVFLWRQKFAIAFGSAFIFILAATAVLFWTTEKVITIQSRNLQELVAQRSQGSAQDAEKTEKELRGIGALLARFSEIQKTRVLWSEKIPEIAGLLPEGIRLRSLSVDSEKGTILLKTHARTREDIERAIEALENSDFIKRVSPPPYSCSFKSTDVDCPLELIWKEPDGASQKGSQSPRSRVRPGTKP